ncbi:MAG: MraY family glycosyltransferase [Bacteroidia bacterium]|nr:undecaprenyl/decaprenyl-phosphate alpha-N-acetylglucosaminyl 1-phosphate transferase [Bacteroidia bacterium]MDW8334058.1 MraY family glycosyltransferase [Bacteroidia bacterium]
MVNKILIRLSHRLGRLSAGEQKQIRWASHSKPLVGGITFYITFLIVGATAAFMPGGVNPAFFEGFGALLSVGTLGFLIGLADDAYETRPFLKFLGQLVCGLTLVAMGTTIRLTGYWTFDAALTIFWTVGIMNSINMLDNMDGITGTVAATILFATLAIWTALRITYTLEYYVYAAIFGSLIGFLILNWNPSKLYMGDTGSQFLGALLAYLGIRMFWNQPQPVQGGEALILRQGLLATLAFLVPIMDTTFVTVVRLSRGRSPFVGGKDHTTHHLSYVGVSDRYVPVIVGVVSFMSAALSAFAILAVAKWTVEYVWLFGGYVAAVFGLFAVLYRKGSANLKQRNAACGASRTEKSRSTFDVYVRR